MILKYSLSGSQLPGGAVLMRLTHGPNDFGSILAFTIRNHVAMKRGAVKVKCLAQEQNTMPVSGQGKNSDRFIQSQAR